MKFLFKVLKKLYKSTTKFFVATSPKAIRNKLLSELSEELTPIHNVKTPEGILKFYCYGHQAYWRASTLLTKEPETIRWINQMPEKSIFWDIGSNVGLYSLYAAKRNIYALAFEPSPLNTLFIAKNIEINKLQQFITLYPFALSENNKIGTLNMTSTSLAGALNQFEDQRLDKINQGTINRKVSFHQGMISHSIDELVSTHGLEIPNYIKIDVDGIEKEILHGAIKTLSSNSLKGILVEMDQTSRDVIDITKLLEDSGFSLKEKSHSERYNKGIHKNNFNYIFKKT